MKILFNASMYMENPTGIGTYIKEVWNHLYKKLNKEEIEYRCYVYYKEKLNKQEQVLCIISSIWLKRLFNKIISVHRVLWNIFYLPFIAKKYDLIYSFSSHGSPFVTNQIITIHDLVCFNFPKQHKFQFLYFKYIMPYIIKASKKIVVISEFTKNEVIKYYKVHPNKITVIYNGSDHLKHTGTLLSAKEKKLYNQVADKKFFLTVGASYPHKNIEGLIEAVHQMSDKTSLVIIGTVNKHYNKLQTLVRKKGTGNIIFMEYISSSFLGLLYRKCIANVYISFYEGFGFPPLEAAAHNKISIVSTSGASYEIYGNAVLYVNPEKINEIKTALLLVKSTRFSFCEYEKRLSELSSKYKWSTTAHKITELMLQK